jgi:hypothetical protein
VGGRHHPHGSLCSLGGGGGARPLGRWLPNWRLGIRVAFVQTEVGEEDMSSQTVS